MVLYESVPADSTAHPRRAFLTGAGAAGLTALTGCLGGRGASAGRASNASTPVSILAAGSFQHALETGLAAHVDVPVEVEAHGSATVARLVAEGHRDPDIVTVADTALFEGPLSPPWYSTFVSNAIVLAYNPATDGGKAIEAAGRDRWYEPLADGRARLGRTDPDSDPLGYRALFTLELASALYDVPDLSERVLTRDQRYPETALVSQFETGAIDAAIAYRNMAVERGYDYVELPARIDLSDPSHADHYASVSYTLPSGQTVRGGVVGYGSTLRRQTDATRAVFAAHTTGGYLDRSGFLRRDSFPEYTGDVPTGVRDAVDQSRRASGATADDRRERQGRPR